MSRNDATKELTPNEISRLRSNVIEGWVGLLGTLSILAGAITLCYQLYLWLKLGHWISIPLSALFMSFDINYSLLTNTKWLGLHKILVWIFDLPVFVLLPIFGTFLGYVIGHLVSLFSELRKKYILKKG